MDLFAMMKNIQRLKAKVEDMKESLKGKVVEGSAGGGMVKVKVSGAQEVLSLEIDPTVWESMDKEVIEDLVVAAVNDGLSKSKELMEEELKRVASELGFPLPGLF